MSALNIAVFGFGGRAEAFTRYALEYPDQIVVKAIAEPDEARRARAAEVFGGAKIFESGAAFYDSGLPVDGVWVLSSDKTHAGLAIPALERGLPLICEKPLATTLEDSYRVCAAHEKNPVPFVIPHSLRYLPRYRKMKECVESGVLGRIMHIHAYESISDRHTVSYYRRGPGRLRSDTLFLMAKCSHDLDIINWMMGGVKAKSVASFGGQDYFKPRPDVPERCNETCRELRTCPFGPYSSQILAGEAVKIDADTEAVFDQTLCAWNSGSDQVDHQTVIIEYEDGTTADFTLRCFDRGGRYLHLAGSDAAAMGTGGDVRLVTYHPHSDRMFPPEEMPAACAGPHGGGDWALIGDWRESVLTGRHPHSATVHESAEAVAVCLAADTAMIERRVVDVEEIRRKAHVAILD